MNDISIWAHIFGWSAFIIGISAFQFRRGHSIILTQIPSNIFYVSHLLMIGATAGAITSSCLIVRNTIALFLPERYLKHLILCISPVVLTLVLMFGESPYGILMAFGNILAGFSLIYREHTLRLRGLQFISQFFFAVYGLISGSYPLAAMGILSMTSNVTGAIRHEPFFADFRNKLVSHYRPESA